MYACAYSQIQSICYTMHTVHIQVPCRPQLLQPLLLPSSRAQVLIDFHGLLMRRP